MTKKRSILLLIGILMLVCCACGSPQSTEGYKNIKLYFLSTAETNLQTKDYALKATDKEAQVNELIKELSTMPEKLEYKAPMMMGFSVLDYEIEDGRIRINVDENYKSLKPTTEVLIRAALVRSFTQIDGIGYMYITVEGEQLHDSLGNVVGLMSAEQFVDSSGSEINAYEKVRLKLYFANEEGNKLVATNRTVAYKYSTNIPIERMVVEQVIAGPDLTELSPTMNEETKVLGVTVKDGVCYVNLDSTFLTQLYSVTVDATIYSLVNSLCELSNINKVQISINGDTSMMYRDVYSLNTMFERNLDIITKLY